MKGIFRANKWNFAKFTAIRCILTTSDLMRPLLTVNFVNWLISTEPDTPYTFYSALLTALLIPIIHCVAHTVWEYFNFEMIEVGHRTHTSLKTILFQKDLRMSSATNKDFSEVEISSIIMNDSNKIWDFIWQLPEYLECPFILFSAYYFTF